MLGREKKGKERRGREMAKGSFFMLPQQVRKEKLGSCLYACIANALEILGAKTMNLISYDDGAE